MTDITHITDAIDLYIKRGIPTGSCTEAILSNDLFDAFGRADRNTRAGMFAILQYIYINCPTGCWGSREAYSDWVRKGGQGVEQ